MPAILVNDVSPVISYTATAGQTLFSIPFEFFAVQDIVVERAGVTLTYSPTPANNNQFSVIGANLEGGGSITLGSPGATLGETIVIYRDVAIERLANYPETGPMAVRSLNAEQAKHIAMMQQLERDIGRSVTVPIGESSVDIPTAAIRANKYLFFDNVGNPQVSNGVSTDPSLRVELAASNGSTLVAFLQSGLNTTLRDMQAKTREIVSVDDYAGTEVEKLRRAAAALTLRGGGILRVPNIGTRSLASAELTSAVSLTSNITVDLEGSTYQVTGATVTGGIFTASDKSNIIVCNGTLKGNSQADAYVNGGAFFYTQTSGAASGNRNIQCHNLHLENFKAPYWIYVDNQSETYPLVGVNVENITFTTLAGNLFGSAITFNSGVIGVQSGEFAAIDAAYIDNICIRNVHGDANFIKSGIIVYNALRNVVLDNITVRRAGFDGTILNDTGAYAIQIYDKWGNGRGVNVTRIDVEGKSCGVYVAGFQDVNIDGFYVSGQTDTVDATLPKGGIVFNGTRDYSLKNGRIVSCTKGIQLNGPSISGRTNARFENVSVTATEALRIGPFTSITMQGVVLKDSRFVSTGVSSRGADIRLSTALNLRLDDLTVDNCYFEGTSYGFDTYALNATNASNNWKFINGCEFKCDTASGSTAIRLRDITGRILIENLKSLNAGQSVAAQIFACTNIQLGSGIELVSGTGGVGLDARSSTGTITDNIRISSATTLVQATSLGLAKPTHSGIKGDVVTAVDFTVAPVGAGQVYTRGWLCQGGTVWRPQVVTVDAA